MAQSVAQIVSSWVTCPEAVDTRQGGARPGDTWQGDTWPVAALPGAPSPHAGIRRAQLPPVGPTGGADGTDGRTEPAGPPSSIGSTTPVALSQTPGHATREPSPDLPRTRPTWQVIVFTTPAAGTYWSGAPLGW